MNEHLTYFLSKHPFPGDLLFAKVWGSRSHNTEKEDSDWDFLGVYAAPIESIIGMRSAPDVIENTDDVKPDYAFYEVRKFCNLLLKGNPGILEMLYTDRMCYTTEAWDNLVENRDKFLSRDAVNAYMGYAKDQYKRLVKGQSLHTSGGTYKEKWAYHIVRILKDAFRIAQGQPPLVWKEGEERDFLMQIRNNQIPREHVEEWMKDRIDAIESLQPWALPDHGDADFLHQWLVKLRLDQLRLAV